MKKRVLLVEYATASIDIIKDILSNPIFSIKVANEGETAKEYLENQPYDLMITAAMLPKFHGFNLSQYAADNYPNMKIIIISEIYKGMNYKHQATTIYKADDFFEKPFNKETFKKRVFELLDIDEDLLKAQAKISTEQIPIADTKKIPTLKKLKEEGEKLTSADLFGDIIDKVQEIPSYEIKLDSGGMKAPSQKKEKVPPTFTEVFGKKAPEPALDKKIPEAKPAAAGSKTQKIDLDILDLFKTDAKEKEQQDKRKFKKIEDDISRRLEDTLSGLGIGDKPAPPAAKKPAPPTEVIRPGTASGIPTPTATKTHPAPAAAPPRPSTLSKPSAPPVPSAPAAPSAPPKATRPPEPPKPAKSIDKEDIEADENEKTDEVGVVGYEILGQIGRGGMAEVYKAKKKGIKGFEKVIALKKILSGYGADSKYIEMFVDEAKITAELSHPNIVQIYDLGKKDDYYFIAMEYVSGKDLRVILQKLNQVDETMPEELAIYIVTRVLEALNYAHSARDFKGNSLDIVHRDISPPNILVSYTGDIKLTDFGVSKASTKMHQTLAGALKGKILYMSPEQAKGESSIDYRSDLYSVGIILFEMLTGEKLFLGTSEIGTLKKVQEGKIVRPSQVKPDIDPQLETILLRALNKDMNKRYQKASDMAKDLEAYLLKTCMNMPESAHIAQFLYNLFKDEILREGIEVNMVTPSPIKKKKKLEDISKPLEPEMPEPPEEDQWEKLLTLPDTEPEAVRPREPDQVKSDEFQPIIEITFDEDKIKDTPEVKPYKTPSPPPKRVPQFETIPLMRETHKQKNLFFILGAIVIGLAIAITLYLVLGTGGGKPETQPPVETLSTTTATTPITSGTEGTPGAGEAIGTTGTEILSSQPAGLFGEQEQFSHDIQPASTPEESSEPQPEPEEELKPGKKEKQAEPTEQEDKLASEADKKKKKKESEAVSPAEDTKTKETTPTQPQQQPQQDAAAAKTSQPVTETPAETTVQQPLQEKKAPVPTPIETEPEIKEGDVLSPSQVDTQPEAISTPTIKITHSIRRILTDNQRILVSYLVDHNGNVEVVKVLSKSTIKKLDDLIIDTIKKWKYKPATKNNIRVKVWKNQWIVIQK